MNIYKTYLQGGYIVTHGSRPCQRNFSKLIQSPNESCDHVEYSPRFHLALLSSTTTTSSSMRQCVRQQQRQQQHDLLVVSNTMAALG